MPVNPPQLDAALPGVVRQIGYFVHDVDKAMASWLAMGIGPFYILRGQVQKAVYRGKPVEVTLSIAFANSGDMQIELVQQLDNDPSVNKEFLKHGEGFSHLAWWTADFDAALKAAKESGLPIVWSGGGNGSARFFYLDAPAGGAADYFEVMELTPSTIGLGTLVREAAVNWDGSNPIRPLG